MIRSSISIFLFVVGLCWAAIVLWFFVAIGGAAELTFAYLGKTLLWYSWMFISPLLLIAGSVLIQRTQQRMGAILSLVGCAVLTVMVGYQCFWMIRDLADPLIMKPPYGLWTLGVVLTVLADAAAIHFYRSSFPTAKKL
jgi:hypothetical protein